MSGLGSVSDLRKVMKKIEEGKITITPNAVSLGWVKAHISIKGKKETDKGGKLSADEEDPAFPVITEGGWKEVWKCYGSPIYSYIIL